MCGPQVRTAQTAAAESAAATKAAKKEAADQSVALATSKREAAAAQKALEKAQASLQALEAKHAEVGGRVAIHRVYRSVQGCMLSQVLCDGNMPCVCGGHSAKLHVLYAHTTHARRQHFERTVPGSAICASQHAQWSRKSLALAHSMLDASMLALLSPHARTHFKCAGVGHG